MHATQAVLTAAVESGYSQALFTKETQQLAEEWAKLASFEPLLLLPDGVIQDSNKRQVSSRQPGNATAVPLLYCWHGLVLLAVVISGTKAGVATTTDLLAQTVHSNIALLKLLDGRTMPSNFKVCIIDKTFCFCFA